ncbi:MAG: hypothetical protein IIA03_10740, partial [Proteobacteria bacterium]|nr:hypothetical protein [Pseudomonadota bacterium]
LQDFGQPASVLGHRYHGSTVSLVAVSRAPFGEFQASALAAWCGCLASRG